MSTSRPTIVVVAFNRPKSLGRLLGSISKARYPEGKVPLCICVDYQDSTGNREVVALAESYEWPHGPKEVIHQSANLGLKAHVLKCGDLTEHFGSIIMLEDDLYVSPGFYTYTVSALEFYGKDERIGGISLYNHKTNFANRYPFLPVEDGSDVYFLQIASSWGQAWNNNQWNTFRKWLASHPQIEKFAPIPTQVKNWPDKSWLKHFITYLAIEKKYFVYPRRSLTTNFGDAGENNAKSNFFYQVPLLARAKDFTFINLEDSLARYDAFFDLLPEIITDHNTELAEYHFVNNLSGLKPQSQVGAEYVLILGAHAGAVKGYQLAMKPIVANVLHDLSGQDVSLVAVSKAKRALSTFERKRMYDYTYGIITLKKKVQNVVDIALVKFWR